MVKIVRTDSEDADFLGLVKELDAELQQRDGEEHAFFAQFNKLGGLCGVVVAYFRDTPVGCGAFKIYTEETAEIKRMFVRENMRGQRIGAKILAELEVWAAELKFTECILETGYKQPEAIALYQRSGYGVIPNYGQYAGVASSVCMTKTITVSAGQ